MNGDVKLGLTVGGIILGIIVFILFGFPWIVFLSENSGDAAKTWYCTQGGRTTEWKYNESFGRIALECVSPTKD